MDYNTCYYNTCSWITILAHGLVQLDELVDRLDVLTTTNTKTITALYELMTEANTGEWIGMVVV